MTNAFVLMTALPPTKGHLNLIEFAADLAFPTGGETHVIVSTQPDEPFALERWFSVLDAVRHRGLDHLGVKVWHLHRTLEQNPEAPGFWEMWYHIMVNEYGMELGDFNVTSELYGAKLAEVTGGVFMPYDPERQLYYTKATRIRNNPAKYFADVLPEFQPNLRKTVTLFGAESTGKTTLSRLLGYEANGHWLFEYARPYLEATSPEITKESMHAIHIGQRAIQAHGQRMIDKPWVVQDTDLFSTVGYWNFPHWQERLGPVPEELIRDAISLKSDLYLITKSNIPFEKDPIRYKSDEGVREGSDEYWIGIAEQYGLNYKVVAGETIPQRVTQALDFMSEEFDSTASKIVYERAHNG
jgi:HTH-type transcriptional repressor of NAD biosynthesis genes